MKAAEIADLIERLADSHYTEAGCTGCSLYNEAYDAAKVLRDWNRDATTLLERE